MQPSKGEKRGPPTSTHRARAYSFDSHASGVDQGEVNTKAISVRPRDELGELKECLHRQQVQLDAILKHLGPTPSLPTYVNPQDFPNGNRQVILQGFVGLIIVGSQVGRGQGDRAKGWGEG